MVLFHPADKCFPSHTRPLKLTLKIILFVNLMSWILTTGTDYSHVYLASGQWYRKILATPLSLLWSTPVIWKMGNGLLMMIWYIFFVLTICYYGQAFTYLLIKANLLREERYHGLPKVPGAFCMEVCHLSMQSICNCVWAANHWWHLIIIQSTLIGFLFHLSSLDYSTLLVSHGEQCMNYCIYFHQYLHYCNYQPTPNLH